MTWDYRVIYRRFGPEDGAHEDRYAIHEVYYDDSGEPTSCTVSPVGIQGETLAELQSDLAHYAKAVDQPALEWGYFEAREAEARLRREATDG